MAFNSGDKVNCSAWTQARMERDLSARRIYGEEELPEGGAGSEFGKKQREEARRKKYGIVTREFKVEDQPWILKVNGKAGKRFKGIKKGGVTENASYYIFTQCPDGAFEAFPVHGWYNFTPVAKHRTLTAEEAEEEWGRRNKVVNHFSIMLQRRLREQERGEEDDDDADKPGKKKKKGGGKGGDLRIHDLDEDLEMSSDDSDNSMGDGKDPCSKLQDCQGARGESETSDDSDIEGETASALFMKKRTPPKRGAGRGSAGSSRTSSRPGTPSIDSGSTSSTLRAAASKLEQGKRPPQGPSADSPAAKRLKMEPSSQSPGPSGKSTPQPSSGKSTPSSSDVQLTEDAVRRYLIRKPMTTKDLLKKFQTKRTGLSSEQTVNVLAQILKRLNPERKNINDKMHFYLTE
uniref:Transcription initiation factor IIF subunit alpha n=1 Tax=Oryzias sinensis TaxID=183150 RepID=A0A8C7XUM0_9TELE